MSKIHKATEYFAGSNAYVIENTVSQQIRIIKDKSNMLTDEELQIKANEIIEKAQQKADSIISKAQEEADLIKEQAKEQAYEEGIILGKKDGFDKLQSVISQAQSVVTEMHEQKYQMLSDLEGEILKLSICISEKVIQKQITDDDDVFLSIISNAIQSVSDAEKISIYISSEQYDKIHDLKNIFLKKVKRIKSFEIIKDELADKFDCLIETDCEQIDAGVNSQIRKIEQSLELTQSYA